MLTTMTMQEYFGIQTTINDTTNPTDALVIWRDNRGNEHMMNAFLGLSHPKIMAKRYPQILIHLMQQWRGIKCRFNLQY